MWFARQFNKESHTLAPLKSPMITLLPLGYTSSFEFIEHQRQNCMNDSSRLVSLLVSVVSSLIDVELNPSKFKTVLSALKPIKCILVQLSRHSNDRNLQRTATLSIFFLADLTMPNRLRCTMAGGRQGRSLATLRALASAREARFFNLQKSV